jgi:hypothetical protein
LSPFVVDHHLFHIIFFIGDGASSLSSSFVDGHHILLIVLSYWWLTPLFNEEGKAHPKMFGYNVVHSLPMKSTMMMSTLKCNPIYGENIINLLT